MSDPTIAQGKSASGADFVGMYTQRDVDSESQLFILDDKTFCFTFTGGALDLIKAGRWEMTANGMLQLQETRLTEPIHPAMAKNIDRLGPRMVGVNFDGYTLSKAYSPVFVAGGNDVLPVAYRPLFPTHTDSWAITYALPLMAVDEIKYFYIGDVEVDKEGRPSRKLRITQYKLDGYDAVRIGFNELQADAPMQMTAQLIDNELHVNRQRFSVKQALTPDILAEVREQCINPIVNSPADASSKAEQKNAYGVGVMLTPVKTFSLDVSVITGEPIFAKKNTQNTTPTDSIEDLLETENAQLQTAFANISSDFKNADEFLQLTQNMAGKKQRLWKHLALMVEFTSKLMVNTNGAGKLKISEKIFFHYMDYIYPSTQIIKDSNIAYNNSVIASQGLILSIALKNTEISNIVFNKLLGKGFAITSHNNPTLIYNLACFYAVNNNKNDMLPAIAQARKLGKPRKQFLDDADFRNYVNDVEFLQAIE